MSELVTAGLYFSKYICKVLSFTYHICFFSWLQSFVDVMREFMHGSPSPSDFIFNDTHFSGTTFKEILQEIGKLELVEMTMLAFLHVSHSCILHSHGCWC